MKVYEVPIEHISFIVEICQLPNTLLESIHTQHSWGCNSRAFIQNTGNIYPESENKFL